MRDAKLVEILHPRVPPGPAEQPTRRPWAYFEGVRHVFERCRLEVALVEQTTRPIEPQRDILRNDCKTRTPSGKAGDMMADPNHPALYSA